MIFLVSLAVPSPTISDINAFLSRGDYVGARHATETANAEGPGDPAIAIIYAKTIQNAASALDLYKKIAADSSFPDSIRAEANFRLGCAAFMRGRYHKAGLYLKKADDPDINIVRFLNAVHDTSDSAQMALLTRQSSDTSLPQGKMACYFMGLYFLAKKDYAASLPYFIMSTGASGDTTWWSCGSSACACFCALSLGRREESASLLRHLNRVFPVYLEKNLLAKTKPAAVTAIVKDTTLWLPGNTVAKKELFAPAAPKASTAPGANFCLQAGAFGSAANAGALKAELSKRYSPVSIMAAIVGDKTIYRVRVGAFRSKESAQTFGDTALAKKGLKFRIVEDVPAE
jgi:tetratricopeptide (TPR) repeat protein